MEVLAAFDISTALTSALSSVVADFTTNLSAIIPAVLGLAAVTMVWHRVRSQIH
jgi:xanthine/uracil/vitamin C permease (AzgA family)